MIQPQMLNYIIQHKNVELLYEFGVEYYFAYPEIYKFILNHYKSFKTIPDIETVLGKFPKFDPIDVTEPEKYLKQKLQEEYTLNETVLRINSIKKDLSKDAVKTVDELIRSLQDIKPVSSSYGTDIIKTAVSRYDTLIDKRAHKEEYMFSTGLDELDIILNGGIRRKEEVIVLYARTNNAKTWIAEKIAVSIWEQGFNVGFFSPEMSAESVGYRFDTLFKNFDNHGVNGEVADFDFDKYKRYTKTLASKDRPGFNVTAIADFPHGEVSVSSVRRWIKQEKLQAVIIDGMDYLKNDRGGNKSTPERLKEIAEDFMTASIELNVPFILVLQANRVGARDSDGEVSSEAPELDTIRGSDGISHNASRAISLYKSKDIIKMYLSKNRYGEKGQHLFYHYDVNYGKFTYTPNPKDGIPIDMSGQEEYKDASSPF